MPSHEFLQFPVTISLCFRSTCGGGSSVHTRFVSDSVVWFDYIFFYFTYYNMSCILTWETHEFIYIVHHTAVNSIIQFSHRLFFCLGLKRGVSSYDGQLTIDNLLNLSWAAVWAESQYCASTGRSLLKTVASAQDGSARMSDILASFAYSGRR